MKGLKIIINNKEVKCLQDNSFHYIHIDEVVNLSQERIYKIKYMNALYTPLERNFNRWLSALFMVYEDRNNYI